MPGFKSHVLVACALYGTIFLGCTLLAVPFTLSLQLLACMVAGALFPDIDIKSKGQQIFYRLLFMVLAVCFFFQSPLVIATIAFLALIPLLVKHRGLFHNVGFLLALVAFVAYQLLLLFPQYQNQIMLDALFFALGVLSHIVLDRL